MSAQRTIARPVTLTGIGLHSGETCTVTCHPAAPDTGMVFVRTDLPGSPSIKSHPSRLCQRMRRTALAQKVGDIEVEVHTTEHFLAACTGLGIDNLLVELTAVELPGLDGSALEFAKALKDAGIVDQGVARAVYDVTEPISVSDGKSSIIALPYKAGLKITYNLDDHGGAMGGAQMVEVEVTEDGFISQIAPARTFCLAKEVEMLRALGLGKGANTQNTVVYDGTRIIDTELRFRDEAARHKVLDLIGDLAHATRRLNAHIIAVRTGHKENMGLVQAINKRIEESLKPKVVFDIRRILELLPHRFPFLLVDKVVEYEPNKRIVGIKNVTVNEPFFTGHFPGDPVMPGVLLVEALAQAGALMLMDNPENKGLVPFFMSVDKVKFRRPVRPGDTLRLEVEVLRCRSRMAASLARAFVEGQLCCEAEIRSVMMERGAGG
jgi:UDP-3-O-[3-hydroxymyristoyl] N-acetylglucosamine deacetylase/3-hydroxyacyl-[acyl-carrier-protein] dehydratase